MISIVTLSLTFTGGKTSRTAASRSGSLARRYCAPRLGKSGASIPSKGLVGVKTFIKSTMIVFSGNEVVRLATFTPLSYDIGKRKFTGSLLTKIAPGNSLVAEGKRITFSTLQFFVGTGGKRLRTGSFERLISFKSFVSGVRPVECATGKRVSEDSSAKVFPGAIVIPTTVYQFWS